jgi:predicted RND superfamily exporter protein
MRSAIIDGALAVSRASIGSPFIILALAGLFILAAGCGILNLQIHVDARALSPRGSNASAQEAAFSAKFGLGDPVIVYLDTKRRNGIFDPNVLVQLSSLSKALERVPGLPERAVLSLATEAGSRVFPGTLRFRSLLDPVPIDANAMRTLQQELNANALLRGTLVAEDYSGASVIVRMPTRNDPDYRKQFTERKRVLESIYRAIDQAIPPRIGNNERLISIVGVPVAENKLGTNIVSDLQTTIPVSVLLIAIITWIGFRRAAPVAAVMAKAGCCLIFTFGLMGWTATPIELTTAIMPIILVSSSVSDEVFLITTYRRMARGDTGIAGVNHSALANYTMARMMAPATITSWMMIIGFCAFRLSDIDPVAQFGTFTALGLVFCWVWSITVTPSLFRALGPRAFSERRQRATRGPALSLDVVARAILIVSQHPRATTALVLFSICGAAFGICNLKVQDSWIDSFSKTSRFRYEVEQVDTALNGTHVLQLYLSWIDRVVQQANAGNRSGPLIEPAILHSIDLFEEQVRSLPSVGGVFGPASYLKQANSLYSGRQLGAEIIPDRASAVSDVMDSIDIAQGIVRRRSVFGDDMHTAAMTVFVKNADFSKTAEIMKRIRSLEAEVISASGGSIQFGGDLAISQAMISAVVSTQLWSLAFTIVGLSATIALLSGSVVTAVVALMPSCLALLALFGFMGLTGVPLGVGTSMICAMTLGIGCDYAVYFIAATRDRRGFIPAFRAVREVGPAILAISSTVALGFGVLAFSSNPVNIRLGLFVAFTLLFSATLTLVGIGAFVAGNRHDLGNKFDASRVYPERRTPRCTR